MSEEKVKDSNELLNIILIILGIFYIFIAVMEFLAGAGILSLELYTGSEVSAAMSATLGGRGLLAFVLGVFAVIAGIGMFREEEWALGMALVILAIIVVNSISQIWGLIGGQFLTSISFWISLVALIIAAIGFVWLLFTTERYH
ncbi:MAG: hypothetical protein EU541_07585 [Promethearchaeota archaeon]|nr:MAG: hypothetical protein EU541_07585 [Candidatus Lokiarchaeota archaeon]